MQFTVNDLRRVMREGAGDTDVADLDGDILGASFAELGYDSLALLECCSRIERQFEIDLADDVVIVCDTVQELIGHVNHRLAEVSLQVAS